MSEGAGMMQISMTLNGKELSVDIDPGERLLDTLRYALGLTGTKEGCGEGECGACSVLMDGVPVNTCLVPSYQARGRVIETVEHVQESDVEPLLFFGRDAVRGLHAGDRGDGAVGAAASGALEDAYVAGVDGGESVSLYGV